jgi:hypothetical protein
MRKISAMKIVMRRPSWVRTSAHPRCQVSLSVCLAPPPTVTSLANRHGGLAGVSAALRRRSSTASWPMSSKREPISPCFRLAGQASIAISSAWRGKAQCCRCFCLAGHIYSGICMAKRVGPSSATISHDQLLRKPQERKVLLACQAVRPMIHERSMAWRHQTFGFLWCSRTWTGAIPDHLSVSLSHLITAPRPPPVGDMLLAPPYPSSSASWSPLLLPEAQRDGFPSRAPLWLVAAPGCVSTVRRKRDDRMRSAEHRTPYPGKLRP